MEAISNAIRPLPPESQAQIRSAVVITSLNDVILGLLENVLDAGATSAEVRLDYLKGYCSVTDNGIGIPAEEFTTKGRLGSLHCTSKHGSTQFHLWQVWTIHTPSCRAFTCEYHFQTKGTRMLSHFSPSKRNSEKHK